MNTQLNNCENDYCTFGEYTIQKVNENHLSDLVDLSSKCYSKPFNHFKLINKFRSCHGTEKYVGYIAYVNKNTPVAYYGVYPSLITNGKSEILVAQSGDTMTHPAHQKKGLFIKLANCTFELCRELGIEAVFGFPNSNSYPGFIKRLNFSELNPLISLTLHENRLEFSRFFKKNEPNKIAIKIGKKIFKRGEKFENSLGRLEHMFYYVKHDDNFFKSKERDEIVIWNICSTNLLIKISGNTLTIGDIDYVTSTNFKNILRKLKFFCLVSGLRFIHFDCSNRKVFNIIFKSNQNNLFEKNKIIFLDISGKLNQINLHFLGSDIDTF